MDDKYTLFFFQSVGVPWLKVVVTMYIIVLGFKGYLWDIQWG